MSAEESLEQAAGPPPPQSFEQQEELLRGANDAPGDPFADLEDLPDIGLPPTHRQRSKNRDTTAGKEDAFDAEDIDYLQPSNGAETALIEDGSYRYYYLTLQRALWNEKSAPDLLEYETDAMERVTTWLQEHVSLLFFIDFVVCSRADGKVDKGGGTARCK